MSDKSKSNFKKYSSSEKKGWTILHASQADWFRNDKFGTVCNFEGDNPFPQIGVNIHVINPGQPSSLYHREQAQENFFVLSGKCLVIIEEKEFELEAGHFVHCPAGTTHVFVGAGNDPCAILMMGFRPQNKNLIYPVSETAARYGASVEKETSSPREAYSNQPVFKKSTKKIWPLD
ncbi:MAG: cupin domain-containing protein [Candidatus Neomarinimicrobiota bacterium]